MCLASFLEGFEVANSKPYSIDNSLLSIYNRAARHLEKTAVFKTVPALKELIIQNTGD